MKDIDQYVERGVLWRAFETDQDVGLQTELGTLILIDEIDKASAGFANSLLVALGSLQFEVPPLANRVIMAAKDAIVLVIMTSNGERELPPALTRRCIVLRVNYPSSADLVQITEDRWPMWMEDPSFRSSVESLAESLASSARLDSRVSTAEFLDLVQVLKKSAIEPSSETWRIIEGLILLGPEQDES
jgi:MoxR-like ATPase